jgi:hypothetical protein
VQVPGAEFQEATCLTDLTTEGTQQTGHTNPKDWAGLNAKETDNPSGLSGLQIDGYFPDDSRTNTNNDHNHDSQFVVRLPDQWNGKLVITGASGNRPQYGNDFIMSDWLLDRGYAFASTDKGNTGEEFYESGENPGDSIAEWNYRVEELTRATKTVVERYYAQAPRFTYITGISNGGYLVRYALENTPELYDGGVDWEGNLFRTEGPNLLTYLHQRSRTTPSMQTPVMRRRSGPSPRQVSRRSQSSCGRSTSMLTGSCPLKATGRSSIRATRKPRRSTTTSPDRRTSRTRSGGCRTPALSVNP